MISMVTWALEVEIRAGKSRLSSLLPLCSRCNAGNCALRVGMDDARPQQDADSPFRFPCLFKHFSVISSEAQGVWRGCMELFPGVKSWGGETEPHREVQGKSPHSPFCSEHEMCCVGASSGKMQVTSPLSLQLTCRNRNINIEL